MNLPLIIFSWLCLLRATDSLLRTNFKNRYFLFRKSVKIKPQYLGFPQFCTYIREFFNVFPEFHPHLEIFLSILIPFLGPASHDSRQEHFKRTLFFPRKSRESFSIFLLKGAQKHHNFGNFYHNICPVYGVHNVYMFSAHVSNATLAKSSSPTIIIFE